MFQNPVMDHAQLIEWTLRSRALEHPPGQRCAYSNFGYFVLGRVIEKVTGQPYPAFVGRSVLGRCGVNGLAIAATRSPSAGPAW